ncbi:hypothetical protein SeLEV6574_g02642 [Synchytrium endobioticum]|uniref:Plasma membrane proteolipid 3 n=1 Tax=Synchytrium endobioticum TaxID=286115 RepID=A0A507D7R6_9FUNG|nr:hypothetical protein SeLEV6574_g02642 [Synchytrium endobioticum]
MLVTLLLFILAFVLPPVAVFMVQGPSLSLCLNVILCIMGWLPGVIHAWVIICLSATPLAGNPAIVGVY